MTTQHKPAVLIILDGWGYREEEKYNAIAAAKKPIFDRLWADCPHTLLTASSCNVGLPKGQMGNSEVGHLNLGAGRVVYQDLSRITNGIEDGSFFKNSVLDKAVDDVIKKDKALHIFGLLSDGGIHSHETHIHAMIKLAAERGAKKIYLHAFLDGRDTPPKSAEAFIKNVEVVFSQEGVGRIASLTGRFYAMDRDKRWDRVEKAYNLLTSGDADHHAKTALEGLNLAYAAGETDEFVKPTAIGDAALIDDGDTVIFMNYRSDRAREITHAFIDKEFTGFPRKKHPKLSSYVALTQYDVTFDIPVAYAPDELKNTLGEYLAKNGKKQLRLAETEKYAHVTFFLNGGVEAPNENEDRMLVQSPKVTTYDLSPEMSAREVTQKLIEAINSKKYDVIIVNYANCDMIGHTGNFDATVKTVECVDECLGQVISALRAVGGEALITADHGNAELMFDEATGQHHTAHTCNLVPFIYVGRKAKIKKDVFALCDIAPTLLLMMGLPIPEEMTGQPIVDL